VYKMRQLPFPPRLFIPTIHDLLSAFVSRAFPTAQARTDAELRTLTMRGGAAMELKLRQPGGVYGFVRGADDTHVDPLIRGQPGGVDGFVRGADDTHVDPPIRGQPGGVGGFVRGADDTHVDPPIRGGNLRRVEHLQASSPDRAT